MSEGTTYQLFTYEEDEYLLTRKDKQYIVCGTCEAYFVSEWYYQPATMYRKNGDPGDPEEFDADINIQEQTFNCEVTHVYDAETMEDCDLQLTENEQKEFDYYMQNKLIDLAEESDEWDYSTDCDDDYDDWEDYEDYED